MPKESIKPREFICSPYIERRINPNKKLSTEEETIVMFAIHNTNGDPREILFRFLGMDLRRNTMITVCKGNFIAASVIDAWSLLPNHKEKYHAPGSITHFFASTNICIGALRHPPTTH
ncbi:hypothetical protein OROHE_016406 [Orobanche hederae]